MKTPAAPPVNAFAEGVLSYAEAGWPCFPVDATTKRLRLTGITGADGIDAGPVQLVTWAGSHAADSIAIRMPAGVIGIDVDDYAKGATVKRGASTLAAHIEQWGPLPATWSSTARGSTLGPGASRIMFFRVPTRRYAGVLGADVEIVQRHHRYAVVAPSWHPGVGAQYAWYRPDGSPAAAGEVPHPEDLAELPGRWVLGLADGATEAANPAGDSASAADLVRQMLADVRPECAEVYDARIGAYEALERAETGARHDACTAKVFRLVQLGAAGHPGVGAALEHLREAWSLATAGEAREAEFTDMLTTAARKAATATPVLVDPCLLAEGFEVAGATPTDLLDADGQPVEAIEPPRWFFPRHLIGTHAFDPKANLDQPLAQAVLERTYPLLRYAYDSRGWLLRVPDRWELHGDLTGRAVTLVAGLLPIGDPTAEKGSDEEARSARRTRFNSNAGRTAIAKTATALVEGGMHPCAVRLADLDSDPELLWAGGVAYDLRNCRAGAPVDQWTAAVDPATPHLQTTAVAPALVPTPLWDAFVAAVWPDEALRAWALRVLSVTLTGRADRNLPILLGETGRGKTQIIALLMSVLGTYAHAADRRLLNAEGARAHQSIVYALKGRRLSFIDEGTKGGQFAEAQLKLLTGGGELTGNQMGQNPITFQPTHTLVLTSNDPPVLVDPAIRDRVRLIPCEGDSAEVEATRAAIGQVHEAAWRAEAPGVLAKMMLEAGAWLTEPSSGSNDVAPENVQKLSLALAHEQDPVKVWLEDETEPWSAGTPSRELYQAFVESCRQSNLRRDSIPSETSWGRILTADGFPARHTERGKRRALRVRPQTPWLTESPNPDGFDRKTDGLLTGLEPTRQGVFSQVSPTGSVGADGSDGFGGDLTRMHAPAPACEAGVQNGGQPVRPVSRDEPTPSESKKPDTPRTESARAKRAAASEAKRLAAVAEAAGPSHPLPATVTAAGALASCTTAEAAALLRQRHAGARAITVDVETTGYPVGHEHFSLRTVQLGHAAFAVVFDPADPEQADVIRHVLAAAPVLHAHSATADLIPLAHAGLLEHGIDEAWQRMADTVIPAKLADPASTGSDPGLKELAATVLGDMAHTPGADAARKALFKAGRWLTDTAPTTPLERSGWAQVDSTSETMIRYAASDVLDDALLAEQLPWIPDELMQREWTAQRLTARVADRGLRLDADQVRKLRTQQQASLADAAERLAALGIDSPGSDQQVAAAVEAHGLQLPRTDTGRPSVAKGVLEPHRELEGPLGDLIRARLDYQRAKNRLGLFLDGWHQAIEHGDGRIRPTIYTLSADTGRMSSVRPNIQQVPRSGGFRSCITADPGHLLISVDFAQVELRVAAALSRDENLTRTLLEGGDIHMDIARTVWGPDAGKAERYRAKPMVFGRLYGSGAAGMARENGVSEGVATQVIAAMDAVMPGLAAWSNGLSSGVRNRTKLNFTTYSGRIVHFDKRAPYKAANYAIQGSARELLVDALIRWEATPWGGCTLFPVHDELVVQVPKADAEAATAALTEAMATSLGGIPILAEPSAPSYAWRDSA